MELIAHQKRLDEEEVELAALKSLEGMLEDEELEDLETKELRLAEERRLRRVEILKKHNEGTILLEPVEVVAKTDGMSGQDSEQAEQEERLLAIAAEEMNNPVTAFDIFSTSPSRIALIPSGGGNLMQTALMEGENPHLQSNWDDGEGYYKLRVGELLCDRYQSLGVVGKGVFATVIKCTGTSTLLSSDLHM